VDLIYAGAFSPDVLEKDALDRLEMQIQELQEEIYRAVKSSLSTTDPPPLLEAFYSHLSELFANLKSQLEAIRDTAEGFKDAAELAASETYLESGVYNVRRCFVAEEDVSAGGTLTLPVPYYPTRNVLWLSYQGMPCTPKIADVDNTGKYQYSEVGTDPNALSNEVTVHFPVQAGDKFDLWIVTSALGKNLEAIEVKAAEAAASAEAAGESAFDAAEGASDAAGSASAAAGSASAAAQSASSASGYASAAQGAAEEAEEIKAEIQSLQGIVTYLDGHDFGDPEEDDDWQQTLTDYALAQAPGWESVLNSCDIVNLWDGHEWIYNVETGLWIDFGASAVATATNDTAGIVKGNATVTGKISVGSDGEMTVNTVPAQSTKLTSALAANSTFAVPSHVAGSGVLKVYLHGLLCEPGTAAANGLYKEIDSTTIRIFEPLPVGARITAVLTA
jgi:hypothetical protein